MLLPQVGSGLAGPTGTFVWLSLWLVHVAVRVSRMQKRRAVIGRNQVPLVAFFLAVLFPAAVPT